MDFRGIDQILHCEISKSGSERMRVTHGSNFLISVPPLIYARKSPCLPPSFFPVAHQGPSGAAVPLTMKNNTPIDVRFGRGSVSAGPHFWVWRNLRRNFCTAGTPNYATPAPTVDVTSSHAPVGLTTRLFCDNERVAVISAVRHTQ